MSIRRLALSAALVAASYCAALADCAEVTRTVLPNVMMPVPNNASIGIIGTPDVNGIGLHAAPPIAGWYHFCGEYMLSAPVGTTLENYHVDIGLDPNNIDTAPAGGSANGHHIPIGGDGNLVTFAEPSGCRNFHLDGSTHVYLHEISAWVPAGSVVTAGGTLNWCRIGD